MSTNRKHRSPVPRGQRAKQRLHLTRPPRLEGVVKNAGINQSRKLPRVRRRAASARLNAEISR